MKKFIFPAFAVTAIILLIGCTAQNASQSPSTIPEINPTASPTTKNTVPPNGMQGSCRSGVDCVVRGCSSQLCVSKNIGEKVSTCEYKEEYSCYKANECGCFNGECQWSPQAQVCALESRKLAAITACVSLCEKQKIDLRQGPCISQRIVEDWVCDVAHTPRQDLDNDPANQCAEYGKTASHFVEVTPDCKLIRAQ